MLRPAALAKLFLSTPSARRATAMLSPLAEQIKISIHALCEEGDVNSDYPSLT